MQNLDVISINLWQVLISLCNLLLLFLILKKFLYQPVRKMLAQRKAQLDEQYRKAEQAQQAAEENRQTYERQLADAHAQAERILQTAAGQADHRAERIVADAREKADGIVREAQTQAALEQKKAQAGIKQEIVDVSEKIDTYETSIQPFEDCCTIFVAKHPVTKPNIDVIRRSEENLNEKIDELMKQAIETVEIIEVK